MSKSFTPEKDSAFDQFFKNITEYASIKSSGARPEWTHISLDGLDAINAAYDTWHRAYSPTIGVHSSEQATLKHNMRRMAERALRDFVDLYLCVDPVSGSDRICMGIPDTYTVSASRLKTLEAAQKKAERERAEQEALEEPHEKVGFRLGRITASDTPQTPQTPPGYVARIAWDVLDTPPLSVNELTRIALAKTSPFKLNFSDEDRGKTAYISVAWQNAQGILGPWGDIQSMIVP